MTRDSTTLSVVEDDGHLPDVFVMEDEDDDLDNVVYMDDDADEAKYLMGVLNIDDAG